jgi:hypothetical protein
MDEVTTMTWARLLVIAGQEGWNPNDRIVVTTSHGHEADVMSVRRNVYNGVVLIDLGADVIIDTL